MVFVFEESFLLFVEGFFDFSLDLNYGVDIELLIVKFDFLFLIDLSVDFVEFVSIVFVENNVINLKI